MALYDPSGVELADPAPDTCPSPVAPAFMSSGDGHVRYSEQPLDWGTRLKGMGGTGVLVLLVVGATVFTWGMVYPVAVTPAPLVVELLSFSTPEEVRDVPEGPQQVEQKEQKPEKEWPEPPPPIQAPSPLSQPMEAPAEQVVEAPPIPETTAPKSIPAPPATKPSSNVEASWEALLLAHLEKYRRYPAAARARREQGVAYVQFRMNRAGTILSARIQRSSGSAVLDSAALETLRRAQPLPPIPQERPDELELSVPVEFFVRR
ncbi:energy transducer TonB family protein [Sandaracinobacteroides hominis]|uniref:energy transducer TonB family protein n=1 Tax=Sandaracinobacteroides hominis TaxID=2780086 RepID=UPI001F42A290|nr:energy transducer TonB [Sandaracinobacteroides hominis]